MPTSKLSVWIGTRKGAFAFSTRNRKTWSTDGPHFKGSEVNHVSQDPREPKRLYAAVNSAWFGPHIHASKNGGKTWKLSDEGLQAAVWLYAKRHCSERLLEGGINSENRSSRAMLGTAKQTQYR